METETRTVVSQWLRVMSTPFCSFLCCPFRMSFSSMVFTCMVVALKLVVRMSAMGLEMIGLSLYFPAETIPSILLEVQVFT